MPKYFWTILAAMTGLVVCVMIVVWLTQNAGQRTRLTAELKQARAAAAKAESEAAALNAQLGATRARIAGLEKERAAAAQSSQDLEQAMRAALESRDVTISQLQGRLTVDIVDRVLFDSGEADLKPDGQAVLRKVAAILAQHPNLKVLVIGHTDNVPIRPAARVRFASNWELSTARALAAVRFLIDQADVDPRRLGALGYGEFHPLADNATPEGRARNRRIAITILPEDLTGLDSTPAKGSVVSRAVPAGPVSVPQPAASATEPARPATLPDDITLPE